MKFSVSLQWHLLSGTKPDHLFFASASQMPFPIKPLRLLNGCIDIVFLSFFSGCGCFCFLFLSAHCLAGWVDGWAGEDQVLESVDTAIPLGIDLAATFSYGLTSER